MILIDHNYSFTHWLTYYVLGYSNCHAASQKAKTIFGSSSDDDFDDSVEGAVFGHLDSDSLNDRSSRGILRYQSTVRRNRMKSTHSFFSQKFLSHELGGE